MTAPRASNRRRASAALRAGAFEVVSETLSNGLRINAIELPSVHRAAIDVHVKVGPRFEKEAENGISHFHEHMLHRGIAGHPTAHQQALAFEELGAYFSAMTYVDHGVLSCSVPPENWTRALELTARLCEAPLFNDIDIEKGIVREELLEDYDARGRLIDGPNLLRQACFGAHPLGFPIAGTAKTLARFDRAALRRFHRRHYNGASVVLTVAGPIRAAELLAKTARRFRALPAGRALPSVATPAEPALAFRYVPESSSQSWLGLAFRAAGEGEPDEPATELLVRLLDDGNATRLYRALSDESGLCYDVGAGYEAYEGAGILEVTAESAHASLPRVLSEIVRVLGELAEHGPDAAELARAKRRFGWQMEELRDLAPEIASFIGLGTLTGVAVTPESRRDELLAVTRERVRAVAEKMFRAARSSLVIVGKLDAKQRDRLRRLQQRIGGG